MDVILNRLDPNVPDPVESRRRAAGRLVRTAYAAVVFGILGFFVVYFGRPLVYLGGPGVVSSPLVVLSLPYVVQVKQMNVTGGSAVEPGEEIGRVWSPQQDGVVATFMRALADVASRSAELRIRERVARESIEVARSYLGVTEKAVEQLEASSHASTAFRVELFRERASARKIVISQEAEIAETAIQLAQLEDFGRQVREHLEDVQRNFADGRVIAPVAGIISTKPARVGQSLVAGSPVAEIHDPRDIFVDWYIPNQRLLNPAVGHEVTVLFGNSRLAGTISEILPVSDVYSGMQANLTRDRAASQIARVRFSPGIAPPALNSTVYVRMYYTNFAAQISGMVARVFGLDRT